MKILLGLLLALIASMFLGSSAPPSLKSPSDIAVSAAEASAEALISPIIVFLPWNYAENASARMYRSDTEKTKAEVIAVLRGLAISVAFYAPFWIPGTRRLLLDIEKKNKASK